MASPERAYVSKRQVNLVPRVFHLSAPWERGWQVRRLSRASSSPARMCKMSHLSSPGNQKGLRAVTSNTLKIYHKKNLSDIFITISSKTTEGPLSYLVRIVYR